MAVFQSTSNKDKNETTKNYQKAAQLQYDFAKAWNDYRADPSKAQAVIDKGEELREVQKALGGKAGGSLAPSQVTLRIDYAKDSIAKGVAKSELTKSDNSVFKYYTNEKGHKVWKIG